MSDPWTPVLYGVVLDEEGSIDYYDTLGEAIDYAERYGLKIVRVETTEVKCLCYSTPEPYCPIHGH